MERKETILEEYVIYVRNGKVILLVSQRKEGGM
jgi:hypothetical protein